MAKLKTKREKRFQRRLNIMYGIWKKLINEQKTALFKHIDPLKDIKPCPFCGGEGYFAGGTLDGKEKYFSIDHKAGCALTLPNINPVKMTVSMDFFPAWNKREG